MKTDSFDWTKINPDIKISYTKKKFYNQFNYRLVIDLPGARFVCGAYKGFGKTLEEKVLNYNELYKNRWYQAGKLADIDQITNFIPIYENRNTSVKFSFTSDTVTIYSETEKYLYDIAGLVTNSSCYEVSVVESDRAKELLDNGYTIVKTKREHPYKVTLKGGFSNASERIALKNYLINLGDHVKITKYILVRLETNIKYFQGGYLYVDDPRLVDMLRLISPSLIGNVNQVVNQ